MTPLRERGYLIPAINSEHVDYVRCAHQLRDSLLAWHPDADITIVTQDMLPYGDQGGQANDWQMYRISPYHETIKLEADMLVCSGVDHWWTLFRNRDVVISTGCRTYQNQSGTSRYYRKVFDDNHLPDVYNAVTYWRVSPLAKDFFYWCREIWQHWPVFRSAMRNVNCDPSTDLVYAIAAIMVGIDLVTMPDLAPQIVHMKPHIAGTNDDWTQELTWEFHDRWMRVNAHTQWGFLHYVSKDWSPY